MGPAQQAQRLAVAACQHRLRGGAQFGVVFGIGGRLVVAPLTAAEEVLKIEAKAAEVKPALTATA